MTGILLLIPFFLIRFGLLSLLNRHAVQRAAHFAPLEGHERIAYWVYQISNVAILLSLFFLRIQTSPPWVFCIGLLLYVIGTFVLAVSIVNFSAPSQKGMNQNGLYQLSRNPMYVAYFLFFTGCALLTQSLVLLIFVFIFQLSAHWIILAEERWCIQQFGNDYLQYQRSVRRYL